MRGLDNCYVNGYELYSMCKMNHEWKIVDIRYIQNDSISCGEYLDKSIVEYDDHNIFCNGGNENIRYCIGFISERIEEGKPMKVNLTDRVMRPKGSEVAYWADRDRRNSDLEKLGYNMNSCFDIPITVRDGSWDSIVEQVRKHSEIIGFKFHKQTEDGPTDIDVDTWFKEIGTNWILYNWYYEYDSGLLDLDKINRDLDAMLAQRYSVPTIDDNCILGKETASVETLLNALN